MSVLHTRPTVRRYTRGPDAFLSLPGIINGMTETFTDAECAALAPYVTNLDTPIFALRNLPEEVVAVLFAYYSRSPHSLRRNLLRLLDDGDLDLAEAGVPDLPDADRLADAREKARAFHEKWVVGYGHASVAEHGCVHLAIEDVSIIASKLVEDGRLASYTEKSTRYVAFDPSRLYYPPAVMADARAARAYTETMRALLDAYTCWTPDFVGQVKRLTPRTDKQTERGHDAAARATTFDTLRYLLPASTHTNIGLTLNARALENLITKLLSQPLTEGRELGQRLKTEAAHIIPTLLKYADHNGYREDTDLALSSLTPEIIPSKTDTTQSPSPVTLVSLDPDADETLVAAILYPHSGLPMNDLRARVHALETAQREHIVDEYLRRRGKHDAPGRALERIGCTMEMVMDYGAYRDIQRHRMATQAIQPLTPALGYETPPLIVKFGYADQYHALMAQAQETFAVLTENGLLLDAPYVLPLATRVRVLFTWNLREVTHFIELRSARQGHPSYRRIAQGVYHALAEVQPLIARYIRPNLNDYALTRD